MGALESSHDTAQMTSFILPTHNRERALKLAHTVLASLDELAAWRVTIEPVRYTRSIAQNNYLWGVPNKMISDMTGYELEEVHEYLLGAYFGWREKRVPKKPSNPKGLESVPRRTTTTNEQGKRNVLTTIQFCEYVEFVQRFAAQKLGLVIPDPDPAYATRQKAA